MYRGNDQMGNPQASYPVVAAEGLTPEPRRELLSRILQTQPFQKSHRLPALLCYLAEHSIQGHQENLTEQRIGTTVFGKPSGYSPAEDSSVRVHVRQLRLRLHEYFAREGRDESMRVHIPKGSYELVFEDVTERAVLHMQPALEAVSLPEPAIVVVPAASPQWVWPTLFAVALAAALLCAWGWYRSAGMVKADTAPWPLSAVLQQEKPTKIVVSDGRAMLRLLADKGFSLDQYLSPGFLSSMTPGHMDPNLSHLVDYISNAQITSYADTLVASTFMHLAGSSGNNLFVCTAHDLNRREIDEGNFIFVGSPTSNPWVSLFADRLNFKAVEEGVGGRMYFLNRHPLNGEQSEYQGLPYTGSGGEDYATLALLPGSSGQSHVLILQGLREEGTEAVAILLADQRNRDDLENALRAQNHSHLPESFEALIRTRTVAGAPVSFQLIATRVITP
ncbi:hypothetical protein [Silvibacterium acidisoli]|uniref:hypothetical protein n=1 Tax=Acidobacteriaceae bacterium ZG23-2 TaxID=2883246 RepID=UPI00406CB91C